MTPLAYLPYGGDFIVAGAKNGHPRNPGWVHSLRAAPDTEIQVGPGKVKVHAREADADERRRLWPEAARYNLDLPASTWRVPPASAPADGRAAR